SIQVEELRIQGAVKPLKIVLIDSGEKLDELEIADEVIIHSLAAGAHGRDPRLLIIADTKVAYVLDVPSLGKANLKTKLSKLKTVVGYDVKYSLKVLLDLGIKELPAVS